MATIAEELVAPSRRTGLGPLPLEGEGVSQVDGLVSDGSDVGVLLLYRRSDDGARRLTGDEGAREPL